MNKKTLIDEYDKKSPAPEVRGDISSHLRVLIEWPGDAHSAPWL